MHPTLLFLARISLTLLIKDMRVVVDRLAKAACTRVPPTLWTPLVLLHDLLLTFLQARVQLQPGIPAEGILLAMFAVLQILQEHLIDQICRYLVQHLAPLRRHLAQRSSKLKVVHLGIQSLPLPPNHNDPPAQVLLLSRWKTTDGLPTTVHRPWLRSLVNLRRCLHPLLILAHRRRQAHRHGLHPSSNPPFLVIAAVSKTFSMIFIIIAIGAKAANSIFAFAAIA